MTSLFDTEYHKATGSENATVVLWTCPGEMCDTGGLFSYWAEPRCSVCGEVMERAD